MTHTPLIPSLTVYTRTSEKLRNILVADQDLILSQWIYVLFNKTYYKKACVISLRAQLTLCPFFARVIALIHIFISKLYTVQCLECTVWSVQCTVFSVHYAVCSVQSLVYSVKCAVYIVQCTVYSVQCAVCRVQCAVCSVQSLVCSVQCTVFSVC